MKRDYRKYIRDNNIKHTIIGANEELGEIGTVYVVDTADLTGEQRKYLLEIPKEDPNFTITEDKYNPSEIVNHYEGLTMEKLEEFLLELTDSVVDTKAPYKVLTGCKTNGSTDLEIENLCNDPECETCSSFRKALQEEAKEYYKRPRKIK